MIINFIFQRLIKGDLIVELVINEIVFLNGFKSKGFGGQKCVLDRFFTKFYSTYSFTRSPEMNIFFLS